MKNFNCRLLRFGLAVFFVAPVYGEYMFGGEPQIAEQRWELTLGAGWSIPMDVKASVPATDNTYVFGSWTSACCGFIDGYFRATSDAREGELRTSTSIDGSLLYNLAPPVSIGIFGGTTLPHYLVFSSQEINLDLEHVDPDGRVVQSNSDGMSMRLGMSYSRALPVVRLSQWIEVGPLRLRPYAVGGAGWYMVSQYAELDLNTWVNDWRFYNKTDHYAGALVAGGLGFGVGETASIALEARYERIFAPGSKLHFFIPSLQFTYHF